MDPKPDDVSPPGDDTPGPPGSASDMSLVQAARHGDRLAFGLLYLRHHAAAWRVACVATRFSADAELALIEGFTRIFSALPGEPEDSGPIGVSFRPYLLACVRQAALDRARAAGRFDARTGRGGPESPEPAPLAGLGPDGEVVLCDLEHHAVRGALAALPERSRTALWLSDVEAMTPAEMAGILGGDPPAMVALAAAARAAIRRAQEAAFDRHEVRAGCRFSADHLEAYQAGTLDPAGGVTVRAHLEECPPCRMRHEEVANGPAALAAAVPDAPLLGGETQQHWLSAPDLRPAARLLPPGVAAAAGTARRLPDALRRAGRAATGSWRPKPDAVDLTDPAGPTTPGGTVGPSDPAVGSPDWTGAPGRSGSMTPPLPPAWTVPPARGAAPAGPHRPPARRPAPARDRTSGRSAAPAAAGLPARRKRRPAIAARVKDRAWPAGLAVAWLVVMLALPRLMTPGTAPGPDGEAMPAVQTYVPGYLPGAAAARAGAHSGEAQSDARPPEATDGAGRAPASVLTVSALAAPPADDAAPVTAASAGARAAGGPAGEPAVGLVSTVTPRRSRPAGPARPASPTVGPAALPPAAPAPAVAPVAVAAITPVRTQTVTPLPTATPAPAATTATAGEPARPGKASRRTGRQRRNDPVSTATVSGPAPAPATTTAGGRGVGRIRKSGGPRRAISA